MKLTGNEIEILEVMWKEGKPLSSSEIVKLSVNKSWKDSSIHILLNSLLKKDTIQEAGYVKTGKGYGRTFEPTISSQKYYADFLAKTVRKTDISLFFSAFFKNDDITEQTIEELEELLTRKKEELK